MIPTIVSIRVRAPITVMKLPANLMACSLPFFWRDSLKIGMKLAAIADAKSMSKKTLGMRLAVRKALAYMPVP